MMRSTVVCAIAFAGITGSFASACGGTGAAPMAPASTPSASPANTAAPPSTSGGPAAWKDMTTEQRKEYMSTVVLPKMKEQFTQFNAQDYGNMSCVTCHGDGAKNGNFDMPNPGLPKLPADEAGFKALMNKKPDVMQFMSAKVVPEMAHLVGEAPYNPETKEGFGCFECHTKR